MKPMKLAPSGEPVECWHLHIDADRMRCVECGSRVRVVRMLSPTHAEVEIASHDTLRSQGFRGL